MFPAVIPTTTDSRYDVIGLDNETLPFTTDGVQLPDLVQISASDLSSDIRGQASSTQSTTTTSSTEEELEDRNLLWVVRLQTFFEFSPRNLGKMKSFWRSYFSKGLKPPTSLVVNHLIIARHVGNRHGVIQSPSENVNGT